MKKIQKHHLLFILITALGISSYIFLNTVSNTANDKIVVTKQCTKTENQVIPEVKAMKAVVKAAKKYIPAI